MLVGTVRAESVVAARVVDEANRGDVGRDEVAGRIGARGPADENVPGECPAAEIGVQRRRALADAGTPGRGGIDDRIVIDRVVAAPADELKSAAIGAIEPGDAYAVIASFPSCRSLATSKAQRYDLELPTNISSASALRT